MKLIGDEAMFIAPDDVAACNVALQLADAVDAHPVLFAARVGIASGEVLCRDGDYYGPVVNLAARAVKVAPPATFAVTDEVRAAVEATSSGNSHMRALGNYALHGLAAPVCLTQVRRLDRTHDRQT